MARREPDIQDQVRRAGDNTDSDRGTDSNTLDKTMQKYSDLPLAIQCAYIPYNCTHSCCRHMQERRNI